MTLILLVGGMLGIAAALVVLLRDRLPRRLPWRRQPDPQAAARARRDARYFSMTFGEPDPPEQRPGDAPE